MSVFIPVPKNGNAKTVQIIIKLRLFHMLALEKGMATHSSILAWRIPWGCRELDMTE